MADVLKLDDAAPVAPGVSVDDLWKYGAIISRVVHTLRAAEAMAVGGVVKLDTLKFEAGSKDFTWNMGDVTRTR